MSEAVVIVTAAKSVAIESELARRGIRLRRAGRELVGPCPVCGGTDRFAVHTGKRIWNCRGCGRGGDVIALVQHIDGSTFRDAVKTLTGDSTSGQRSSAPRVDDFASDDFASTPIPKIGDDEHERHAKHLMYARSIWDAAKPTKGTLVEQYLVETRKLALPETDAIRFHPRLRVTHTDRFAPAMVCRMTDIRTDEFTGVHRTFLTDTAQKISKTILGRKHGSAIKIDSVETVGEGLAIAEGVESTLAARYLYRPAWSVIDAGGMRHFPVLPGIEHLEIFADHDANGAGEAAARHCLERWESTGAEVAIVMPPTAGSDIPDFIADRKVYCDDRKL